jgi:hypothetical protein
VVMESNNAFMITLNTPSFRELYNESNTYGGQRLKGNIRRALSISP